MKSKQLPVFKVNPENGVNNEYPTSKYAFRQPCLWYISAVRNSGKSFLASKFLAQAKKDSTFDKIYIITPSFKSNEAYFGKYINEEDVCTRVSSKEHWSVPSQAASSPSLLGHGEHEHGSLSAFQQR